MSNVENVADQPMQPAPPSLRMLMILGGISMLDGLLVRTSTKIPFPSCFAFSRKGRMLSSPR